MIFVCAKNGPELSAATRPQVARSTVGSRRPRSKLAVSAHPRSMKWERASLTVQVSSRNGVRDQLVEGMLQAARELGGIVLPRHPNDLPCADGGSHHHDELGRDARRNLEEREAGASPVDVASLPLGEREWFEDTVGDDRKIECDRFVIMECREDAPAVDRGREQSARGCSRGGAHGLAANDERYLRMPRKGPRAQEIADAIDEDCELPGEGGDERLREMERERCVVLREELVPCARKPREAKRRRGLDRAGVLHADERELAELIAGGEVPQSHLAVVHVRFALEDEVHVVAERSFGDDFGAACNRDLIQDLDQLAELLHREAPEERVASERLEILRARARRQRGRFVHAPEGTETGVAASSSSATS